MDYAMEHMLRSAGTIMFHGFYKDVLLQRGWHKECSQYTDGLYTQIKEVDFDLCPPRQVEDKTIVQVRLKDGVKVTSTIGEVKEDPAHLFGYLLMLDK